MDPRFFLRCFHNLPYGPRTRLIRGMYVLFCLQFYWHETIEFFFRKQLHDLNEAMCNTARFILAVLEMPKTKTKRPQ